MIKIMQTKVNYLTAVELEAKNAETTGKLERAKLIRAGLVIPEAVASKEESQPKPRPSRLYQVQERQEQLVKKAREAKYALPQ